MIYDNVALMYYPHGHDKPTQDSPASPALAVLRADVAHAMDLRGWRLSESFDEGRLAKGVYNVAQATMSSYGAC